MLRVRYQSIADETERRNEYRLAQDPRPIGPSPKRDDDPHRQHAEREVRLNRGAAQPLGKLFVSVQGRGPGREEDGGDDDIDDDESAGREEQAPRGARDEPQRGRDQGDEEGEREAERVVVQEGVFDERGIEEIDDRRQKDEDNERDLCTGKKECSRGVPIVASGIGGHGRSIVIRGSRVVSWSNTP